MKNPCLESALDESNIIETLTGTKTTADKCRKACKESNEGKTPDDDDYCNFFNFLIFKRPELDVCQFLKEDCPKKNPDIHTEESHSGPVECTPTPTCGNAPEKSKLHWSYCFKDGKSLNAYEDDLVEDTECQISCAGSTYTAVCKNNEGNAEWEWKEDAKPDDESTIKLPDDADGDCTCTEIELKYDPAEEDGALFYCTTPLEFKGDPCTAEPPAKIDPDNECILVCDGHLTLEIRCKDGKWTEEISSDKKIACYVEPPKCD